MIDRNTIDTLKKDIDFLEEVAAFIEYGDTGSALQLIDDWQAELSDLLSEAEDDMALFEADYTAYQCKKANRALNAIIETPTPSFPYCSNTVEREKKRDLTETKNKASTAEA